MILILLLLSVVLLLYFVRPHNNESYRIAVMAIVGFAYFIAWRFVQYLSEIYFWEESSRFLIYGLIGLIAILICITSLIRNIRNSHAIGLAVIFGVSVLFMLGLENTIKNQLSYYSGYYDDPKPQFAIYIKNKSVREFKHEYAGYGFNIPNDWLLKLEKGEQFPYFLHKENEFILTEFRPKCNFGNNIPLAEVVSRVITSESQKQCFKWQENRNACLIKIQDQNTKNSRWRLFVESLGDMQGAELDFIFYDNVDDEIKTAESIMHSLQFNKNYSVNFSCLGVADWL